jgi:methylenetetrahydrofolate dehydrogenase (NAD+)
VRECTAEDLESKLEEANADPEVHGIMVYYPVFGAFPSFYGGTMDDYLRDSISHEKVSMILHRTKLSNYRHRTLC